jgi:aromatic ring-opening dioxygenase LigB subunit
MLCFSAFVPTNPILIPTIGKDHFDVIKKTREALLALTKLLIEASPTTLLFLSYPEKITEKYIIQIAPEYQGNLEAFGDFATKITRACDPVTAYKITRLTAQKFPLEITGAAALNHTVSVPLLTLTALLPNLPMLPIFASSLPLKDHFTLGQELQCPILRSHQKIAIIASGNLSYCQIKKSSEKNREKTQKFDQTILTLLNNKETEKLITLEPELLQEVQETGLKTLSLILGMLKGINYNPTILSYERSLGAGHLVVNFKLPKV